MSKDNDKDKGINKGRKPLKSKPKKPMSHDDLFGNPLKIPEALAKELAAKGLGGHWISYKQLQANAGYHKKGWVPYKQEKNATISNEEFHLGVGPDGLIRRGSLILGVKSLEAIGQHKEYLSSRADGYKDAFQRRQANELRKSGRRADESFVVHEGYDDGSGAFTEDNED